MRMAVIAIACSALWVTNAPQAASYAALREDFNKAARELKAGKHREAETLLEGVLASQNEKLQPKALYNLGHVRFQKGVKELEKSEAAGPAAARGRAASMHAEEALSDGREAMQSADLARLINSYVQGRGALRDLRGSIKAVSRALKLHATALNRWERASSDWKSAFELDPSNKDAQHNAAVADQHIARLIDSIKDLQQSLAAMQNTRDELKNLSQQMKGRIPEENMPPGAAGDEEEEDEEGGQQPPPGHQEAPSDSGKETPISPEEAGWMLEGLKSGDEKRLPMGQEQESKPRDKNRSSW